jgi:hypothetical protein
VVGTRKPRKGQNMEINEKRWPFWNVYTCKKYSKNSRIHIFLDETGCVLNEKITPDVAAMVPEIGIYWKVSKSIFLMKMWWARSAHSNWGGEGVGGVITDPETQQYKNSHYLNLKKIAMKITGNAPKTWQCAENITGKPSKICGHVPKPIVVHPEIKPYGDTLCASTFQTCKNSAFDTWRTKGATKNEFDTWHTKSEKQILINKFDTWHTKSTKNDDFDTWCTK